MQPTLNDYSFPSDILTDEILAESLNEKRTEAIRKEIQDIYNPHNTYIRCHVPWNASEVTRPESLDFIFSQAVLEHVEELDNTYATMKLWLKPSGMMSHTIDYKSHGVTKLWNGQWRFGSFAWTLVKGGKIFLINRQPYSRHLAYHTVHGFTILRKVPIHKENTLSRKQLSSLFRDMPDIDLTTSGAYIFSKKDVTENN